MSSFEIDFRMLVIHQTQTGSAVKHLTRVNRLLLMWTAGRPIVSKH